MSWTEIVLIAKNSVIESELTTVGVDNSQFPLLP